jgi:hypothetical protein
MSSPTAAAAAAAANAAAAQFNALTIKPNSVKLDALTMFTGRKDQDKNQQLQHWQIALSVQEIDPAKWAECGAARIDPAILPIFKAGEELDFKTMTWEEFCTRFRNISTAGSTINTAQAQHTALTKLLQPARSQARIRHRPRRGAHSQRLSCLPSG